MLAIVSQLDEKTVEIRHEFALTRAFWSSFGRKLRRKDRNQDESKALWETKMAPKKRKGCKNRCKSKSWTEKQTKLFATVLATTANRDKPFAYVLETVINEFCFSRKINLDARDLFNWELSTKCSFVGYVLKPGTPEHRNAKTRNAGILKPGTPEY